MYCVRGLKNQKNIMVHKYQKCTWAYILCQMIGHSLKNMFDSFGFAHDFAFCQNKWSLEIFQNVLWKMSFKNEKIYQSVWGGGVQTNIKKK